MLHLVLASLSGVAAPPTLPLAAEAACDMSPIRTADKLIDEGAGLDPRVLDEDWLVVHADGQHWMLLSDAESVTALVTKAPACVSTTPEVRWQRCSDGRRAVVGDLIVRIADSKLVVRKPPALPEDACDPDVFETVHPHPWIGNWPCRMLRADYCQHAFWIDLLQKTLDECDSRGISCESVSAQLRREKSQLQEVLREWQDRCGEPNSKPGCGGP